MSSSNEKPKTAGSENSSNTPTVSGDNVEKAVAPAKNSGEHPKLDKLDSKYVVKPEEEADPLAHLPPHEAEIIRRQTAIPEPKINYFSLYRYASRSDLTLLFICHFASIAAGAVLPLMTVVFGNLAGEFADFFMSNPISDPGAPGRLMDTVERLTLYFVYMGVGEFVLVYTATVISIHVGEKISGRIRQQFLAAILRQNIGFFDKLGAGEVTTRITADVALINAGISEKVSLTLYSLSTFVSAFVIAFVRSWKLTLILFSAVVAINLVLGVAGKFMVKYNKKAIDSYAKGGTVAEEVLSSIRNAVAFGTQGKLAEQYEEYLDIAEHWGKRHKGILAFMLGALMTIIYLNYGLAFWQGSRFYIRGDAGLNDVVNVLMAIIIGAFSLGGVAPHVQAMTTAVAAAAKIYGTIDRQSPLDSSSDDGGKIENLKGDIELVGIKHIYPSRPEVVVIEDMNLKIPAGKTTALVGASGSGKSTIVGLVERFYDPVGGEVLLDGHDIKTLNLRWLRENISLVQQEPVLFNASIYANVAFGLIGTPYENAADEKKRELIEQACEMSNAAQFINSLPEGYETNVGERGFSLSGGQKQRIAIARAIVSDPKILLLDEATSALDTRSEGIVQAALDKAAQNRTSIIIAHRLSTIKNADNIVVMSQGRIVEQGKHDELLEAKGPYYMLVEAQKFQETKERPDEDEEDEKLAEAAEELKLQRTRTKASMAEVDPDDLEMAHRLNRADTSRSAASAALAAKPDEVTVQYSLWTLIKLIGSYNKTEKLLMAVGVFLCIIAGGGYPVQSVLFAKSIGALSLDPKTQRDKIEKEINFWSAMYIMLAATQLISYTGQGVAFAYCSEKLVKRVRTQAFRTLLRQDISYFDDERHTSGALTTLLSTETTFLAGLSGATLGTISIVLTTLIASFVLSLAIAWKLALVVIATVPILLACGFFRFWILARFESTAKAAYEKSASYACEATSSIRTVATLTREQDVLRNYHNQLVAQEKRSFKNTLKSSSLYAMSQSFVFLCVALGFWWGGNLISKYELTIFQFFVCFTAVIFGAQSAGTIFSFSPDMGKAKHAAQTLKELFDRKPEIDSWSEEGQKLEHVEGTIEFTDVHFRYPTRPTQPVLRGLSLIVKPGQYVALVGPSGCGKSTTISLIERFYNPLTGSITLDDQEISDLNIKDLRSHMALVSQEPTLYQGTIRHNIVLGALRDDVTDEEVFKACKDANIYDFIMSLPEGFQTVCGSRGVLLSGGQKQRIAIARALIRNPKILLLDEATSALDSESEKVVQAALDNARAGRTTICVAHRLSTIQNADVIYVFDQGRIVESGTHQELMALKKRYAELVKLQGLGKTN
ncbi:GTPase-activating protein [Orbilia oligospora]|uniref:GTPase-activating protein n=1 Tax=Orbilia oligospora TaxID=2813651 RepID=A0A7C8TUK3_ORBOL|nr:GTPase-activating protein [Orbilia oligospora]KAF3193411.1 GTPase-activating protein [Orbilia oligospora]KAF3240128.1 GTPase-activating protein [Orbilia oligospora]KAF3243361.1 GTPase-activating protein [Orbilia oligospora]KAF3296282.1 GTPase-activating protein [Orbilia oligospora]